MFSNNPHRINTVKLVISVEKVAKGLASVSSKIKAENTELKKSRENERKTPQREGWTTWAKMTRVMQVRYHPKRRKDLN